MRPIDGDKLIGVFYDLCSKQNDPTAMLGLGYISAFIESKEVAITLDDLRPKGRWVCLEPEIGYYACSECDHRILRAKCNYCPGCGARMEEPPTEVTPDE